MGNWHPSKTNVNLGFASVDIVFLGVTIYIYHMASRETYQNISPEVTRKPCRVMSPDAEGRGWHNAPGLSCHWGADFIHMSHGFEGDISEYQPLGDKKSWHVMSLDADESPGGLCHPMPKAEGDVTHQGFRVTEGLIFWYSRTRRHVIYVMWHF